MSITINEYKSLMPKLAEILPKGAFLTTSSGGKANTMTIGWGSFGFEWGIPTAEVMVRESRYTKSAMDTEDSFTITFPLDDSMKSALSYCGQKSGRDTDKILDCGLKIIPAKEVSAPVVACKGLVLECKTITRTAMDEKCVRPDILEKWYKSGDLHTFYFAEVVACYELN